MNLNSAMLSQPAPRASTEPSLRQTLAIVLASYLVFFLVLRFVSGSFSMVGGPVGDNGAYEEVASAICHWRFSGVVVKQFWGLAYAIAAVCFTTGMSERAGLVFTCIVSSLVAVTLCHRMWGGWITLFFALLNFEWFQRSLLGGAEPLFVALILACFFVLRRAKWAGSALFGALATVVRPFGVFALAGLGLELLWKKKYREFALATAISLVIGAAYAWPVARYLGSPFANVTLYKQNDWHRGSPFTFPLLAILRDTFPINAPLTNLALTWGWILFVLLGLAVAILRKDLISYGAKYPAEICFVLLYCTAVYTYNAPGWSRGDFPRFVIPVVPWTFVFLKPYLPARRWVIAILTVITPTLAAASAVGIRNVMGMLLKN